MPRVGLLQYPPPLYSLEVSFSWSRQLATVTLHIDGMSCGHCLRAVQQALTGVSGAEVLTVQMGRAVVQTTPDGPTGEVLAGLVTTAGYPTTATVLDAHHD